MPQAAGKEVIPEASIVPKGWKLADKILDQSNSLGTRAYNKGTHVLRV